MRFGLGDPRNYDSVELTRSLDWLAPLFEAGGGAEARTSRREVTWEGVRRARARLERAGVGAGGGDPPPAGWAGEVERLGEVWIAWLSPDPWADSASGAATGASRRGGIGRDPARGRGAGPDPGPRDLGRRLARPARRRARPAGAVRRGIHRNSDFFRRSCC
ncbi:MAG: hypothetical protein U0790_27555 [Isosphaeraceae bacterium]